MCCQLKSVAELLSAAALVRPPLLASLDALLTASRSPEAIFDIDYFVKQPHAFYALAKELYPGNFKPTHTHYFFKLLQEKGILRTVCARLSCSRRWKS